MPGLPPQLGKIQGLVVGNADDLGDTLKSWNESLRSMSEDFAPETLSPEDKKELKSRIDELKKQLDKLNKRLQKPAEKPAK
jgi:Tfp pilus assembly protein FimV